MIVHRVVIHWGTCYVPATSQSYRLLQDNPCVVGTGSVVDLDMRKAYEGHRISTKETRHCDKVGLDAAFTTAVF